ncbi:MAG: efflux transporter outer membrane subunit [Alphaproteobacteria bacterium]
MKKTVLFTMMLASGCSLSPVLQTPSINTPPTWRNTPEAANKANMPANDGRWWHEFGSREIPLLLAKTEVDNPDLQAALARLEQSKASAHIASAPLWPEITANGNSSRNFASHSKQSTTQNSYRGGFQAAYEVDLFGKNHDAERAALWQSKASEYDSEAIRLALNAQTAEAYFNLLAFNERVRIAEENLNNARDVLRILRIRKESGSLSALEVAQQENFVSNSKASLLALQQQQENVRNALALLLGSPASIFELQYKTEKLQDLTPPTVPTTMPAEWLCRRPDIAQAEAALQAANFDIGVARAAFFPSLTLDASTALVANPASAPAATISSLAASIALPLFTHGRIDAGIEKATARQKELAAQYRKTILTAYSETENALMAVKTQKLREESLNEAVKAAQTAYNASHIRFEAGAIDGITLLDAQRSLLQAKDAQIEARAQRLAASVDLFRAMGGGWKKTTTP